jgi:hypothetical protein
MGNELINLGDKNIYNHEGLISMNIFLSKACYFQGEVINGYIFLIAKKELEDNNLKSPSATITLREVQHYELTPLDIDIYENQGQNDEEKVLVKYPINFSNIEGENLSLGIKIPFQCQIPENCKPTCIFEPTSYISHFLDIEFTSINAKKTSIIIIKNSNYFTTENNLYKSPVISKIDTSKHEYGIFSKGSFTASIKLPKNCFTYDEIVPFVIEINSSNLKIDIKTVKVSLNAILKVRSKFEPGKMRAVKIKEIVSKNIPLQKGEKMYSIDDVIKIPSTSDNPSIAYKKFDSDQNALTQKFGTFLLYPTCYGEKLSCEYIIRVMIEIGSLFSTNEILDIPLDFYEPQNNNNNIISINNNNNINQGFNNINQNNNIETPLGNNPNNNNMNKIIETPLVNNPNNNNMNKIIETPLGNNPNNNNMNIMPEDFEAPPSLQQSLNLNNNFMVDKP